MKVQKVAKYERIDFKCTFMIHIHTEIHVSNYFFQEFVLIYFAI